MTQSFSNWPRRRLRKIDTTLLNMDWKFDKKTDLLSLYSIHAFILLYDKSQAKPFFVWWQFNYLRQHLLLDMQHSKWLTITKESDNRTSIRVCHTWIPKNTLLWIVLKNYPEEYISWGMLLFMHFISLFKDISLIIRRRHGLAGQCTLTNWETTLHTWYKDDNCNGENTISYFVEGTIIIISPVSWFSPWIYPINPKQ